MTLNEVGLKVIIEKIQSEFLFLADTQRR